MTYVVKKTVRGRENRSYGNPAGRENMVRSDADSPTPPPSQFLQASQLPTGTTTTIAWLANVATHSSTSHGLTKGDIVRVSGANEAYFNGDFRVDSVADANTFTVAVYGSALASSGSGTITARKLLDRIEF